MAAHLLFSSTIVQYFQQMGQNYEIQRLDEVEKLWLEKLALARQMITSRPKYARSILEKFCEQHPNILFLPLNQPQTWSTFCE